MLPLGDCHLATRCATEIERNCSVHTPNLPEVIFRYISDRDVSKFNLWQSKLTVKIYI